MLRSLTCLCVVLAVSFFLSTSAWGDPRLPDQYDCPYEVGGAGDDDQPHIQQPPTASVSRPVSHPFDGIQRTHAPLWLRAALYYDKFRLWLVRSLGRTPDRDTGHLLE